MDWENNRQAEIKELTSKGIVPVGMEDVEHRPHLMGVVAAVRSFYLPLNSRRPGA
jgi:hypothetical protein